MSKSKALNAANILSLSRFILLPIPIVFVLMDMRVAFLIAYILLGSTDFFDGIVARRYKMTSELGKKLDSFADLFFYLASAWFLYVLHTNVITSMPNFALIITFLSLLVISFVVSGIVCKKPVLMHTIILKFNAVILYLIVIFAELFDVTYLITGLAVLYIIGIIEEMVIFVKFGDIDPDSKSFFHLLNDKKKKKEATAGEDADHVSPAE
ncbi:MAG: CDP-alcohol phosphatidyltransferase family protein [Clostridiales bacterium]|nr:CDP-alcohol phosphatidyltransferase family protein [Clostridiales bacterium]